MLDQLIVLRRDVLYAMLIFAFFFLICFFWANELFHYLLRPLIANLPGQSQLIATQVAAPLFTPLKLAGNAALLCTTPLVLLKFWSFAAPALYQHERHPLKRGLVYSMILFFLGILFCYFFVLPSMFQLFVKVLPADVKFLPDITNAVDFITHMLLVFGLCFQLPLVCIILVRMQWVSLITLKKIRPYTIVLAFIIGMLLTPPDVLSQIMLAVPLCLLYELGIFLAPFQAL